MTGGSAASSRYIVYSDVPGGVVRTQGSSLVPVPVAISLAPPVRVAGAALRLVVWHVRVAAPPQPVLRSRPGRHMLCLLYTSDAADEEDSVDLGGRRII